MKLFDFIKKKKQDSKTVIDSQNQKTTQCVTDESQPTLNPAPCRTIYIDNTDSMNCGTMLFEADYRELSICQSAPDTCSVVLRIYSVYNGRPQEGGRIEGYTFTKTIEVPAEQYYWSDEELIAEYIGYFKR